MPEFDPIDLDRLELDPLNWLIPGWLTDNGITLLVGDGGSGKSLVALDAAISLAVGRDWLAGPDGVDDPAQARTVWYFDEDGSPRLMKQKLARLTAGMGINPAALKLSQRLEIHSSLGNKVDGPRFISELVTRARGSDIPPNLLIFDALVAFSNANENDNSAMREVMRDCFRQIATVLNCSILLIHHTNKPGEFAAFQSALHRARGASEIINASDCVWSYRKSGGKGSDRRLNIERSRFLAENDWPDSHKVHLNTSSEAWYLDCPPSTEIDRAVLAMTGSGIRPDMTVDKAADTLTGAGHKFSRSTVGRALKQMKARAK